MKISFYKRKNTSAIGNEATKKAATIFAAAVLVTGAALLIPGAAHAAATTTPWDGAASSVLAIFTGGLARTIAIIAVIACGVAAVAGKLSWDWAIKIIVGLVLIFGATSFVDYIIAGTT